MDRWTAVEALDNPQEWSEGTADYVERRFAALAGITDMLSLEESLAEPFEMVDEWAVDMFSWDRFYATGDAQGVLMDRAGISWRPAIARGETQVDILMDVLSLSASEQADLLAEAKGQFDYPALLAQAREWEE